MSATSKKDPQKELTIPRFVIGLGWEINSSDSVSLADYDLDTSALLLNSNGQLVSDHHFIFYNNTHSPDGAVEHSGDNRTGTGKGDDEYIRIDLEKLSDEVTEILIIVTIHKGVERGQSFGQIRHSYIRILDSYEHEFFKYYLDKEFTSETAIEFCRIKKEPGGWKFNPTGVKINEDLMDFINKFRKK